MLCHPEALALLDDQDPEAKFSLVIRGHAPFCSLAFVVELESQTAACGYRDVRCQRRLVNLRAPLQHGGDRSDPHAGPDIFWPG